MPDYEIWIDSPTGYHLKLLDGISSLTLAMALNQPGAFEITLPEAAISTTLIRPDNMLEIWRAGRLELVGLLDKWRFFTGGAGARSVMLSGAGMLDLLARRIVAYPAGAATTDKSAAYDDMIKAVVRENLGSSATDADRDLTGAGMTVQADLTAAPVGDRAFAYDNVLKAAQEIADASRTAGTWLYFDFVPVVQADSSLKFDFRTFVNLRGTDRTATGGRPTFAGAAWGNIEGALLEYDYSEEANVVYGGGQGEEAARTVYEAEDTTSSKASPWARREWFQDARNEKDATGVQNKAEFTLAAKRPRLRYSARLLDVPQSPYGSAWNLGDKITAVYSSTQQFDAEIRAVRITLDGAGKETIDARLEVDA